MIVCDNYVDMNTADADDTPVTVTIMDNGTQGTPQGTYAITENSVGVASTTSLKIKNASLSPGSKLDDVSLNDAGLQFLKGSTHRPLGYDNLKNFTYVGITPAGGTFYAMSTHWIVKLDGPQDAGVSGTNNDHIGAINGSGDYAIVQLLNGNAPNGGGYAYNLHTNPGGVTTQTGHCVVVVGGTYRISLYVDFINETAELFIRDVNGVLLSGGHITAATNSGHTSITNIRWGNAETSISTGITYFDEGMIDWTRAANPLGPFGPPKIWLLPKTAAATATGALANIPVTHTNVAVGDIVGVAVKWEGGAATDKCTVDDGTYMVDDCGFGVQFNAVSSINSALFWYRTTKSGSVTFTAKFFNASGGSVTRTFRDIEVIAYTPGFPCIVERDGQPVGGTSLDATHGAAGNPPFPSTKTPVVTSAEGVLKLILVNFAGFGASAQGGRLGSNIWWDAFIEPAGSAAKSSMFGIETTTLAQNALVTVVALSGNNAWNLLAAPLSIRPLSGASHSRTPVDRMIEASLW